MGVEKCIRIDSFPFYVKDNFKNRMINNRFMSFMLRVKYLIRMKLTNLTIILESRMITIKFVNHVGE